MSNSEESCKHDCGSSWENRNTCGCLIVATKINYPNCKFCLEQDEVISQMAQDNVRLEKENKELRGEVERLKNLTHFGYSQVPYLESKLKKALEALKAIAEGAIYYPFNYPGGAKDLAKQALSMLEGE